MRISLLFAFLAITILFTPAAFGGDKEDLVKIERDWNEAYNRHDRETVGSFLGDDYSFIDADAYVLNKKQYLDTMAHVETKSDNLKDIVVRIFGDAAVVTTVWSGTYSFDGKETTETLRYSDVFVKRNGKWQAVATQGTRLPQR